MFHNKMIYASVYWAFAFAIAIAFIQPVHAAEKQCQLRLYGELPVTMSGTQPLIAGTVNGVETLFLADSGAFFSSMSRQSAEKFNLKVAPLTGLTVKGVGGSFNAQLTTVKNFGLPGFRNGELHDVDFVVGGSHYGYATGGIIGQNVIGYADTEYDLANGYLRLFHPDNCKASKLAYWDTKGSAAIIDIKVATIASPHLIGTAMLNGKKIRVMFDTGASVSMLARHAAERAGFKPDGEGVSAGGMSYGIGDKPVKTWITHFDMLDLGGEQIKNARIRVGDTDSELADLLLGADFFLSHRVYASNLQHKMYFTYNGGPVFDLKFVSADQEDSPSTESTPQTEPEKNAPKDAAGYRRRGMASIGRNDYRSAMADFDQAIKLDPTDAENFHQRALTRWRENKVALALSDYDQAVTLKPNAVPLLMERGRLRLQNKNETGAAVDFAMASQLSPNDSVIGFQIAGEYDAERRYDESIKYYDAWVAAFPKDARMPVVLNNRCWDRAMLRKELDLALNDCNAALKFERFPNALDSRGLVWLLRGDFDHAIADYKAVLKAQPNQAWSLYGLGIAQIKKGAKAEGDNQIQAAIKINPKVVDEFKRLELEP